jgi:hypothetical protein
LDDVYRFGRREGWTTSTGSGGERVGRRLPVRAVTPRAGRADLAIGPLPTR